jgi:preprotein translocase subunit SecG
VNDTVEFESIVFPYDFSVAAFIYTDDNSTFSSQIVECNPDAQIPDSGTRQVATIPPPVKGVSGAMGPVGYTGSTGFTGDTGIMGLIGNTGDTGIMGAEGVKGAMGINGTYGATGPIGSTGYTGPVGNTGAIGATGATGATGAKGPAGRDGEIMYNDTDSSNTSYSAVAGSSEQLTPSWTSENYMVGVVIWLSILSFIVIIFLILLVVLTCTYRRRRREVDQTKSAMRSQAPSEVGASTNGSTVEMRAPMIQSDEHDFGAANDIPAWMDDMREETTLPYSTAASATVGPYAGRSLQAAFTSSEDSTISKSTGGTATNSRESSPPPYEMETDQL